MNEVKKFIILFDSLKKEFKEKTSSVVPKFKIKLSVQEYPTEPLDKIPALQGRIALAGKLNIGHTHLLENLYEHHARWEFMLQRWFWLGKKCLACRVYFSPSNRTIKKYIFLPGVVRHFSGRVGRASETCNHV